MSGMQTNRSETRVVHRRFTKMVQLADHPWPSLAPCHLRVFAVVARLSITGKRTGRLSAYCANVTIFEDLIEQLHDFTKRMRINVLMRNVVLKPPLVRSSALARPILKQFLLHLHVELLQLRSNNMAYAHSKCYTPDLGNDIISTSIIVKYIPLDWKTSHVLHLMDQMQLPSPIALNYMYDDFKNFRGMAFATFASSGETWQVIQKLNRYWVSGRVLNVQYKKKRPEIIAMENSSPRTPFQPNYHPHTNVRDMAYMHPLEKASPVPRPIREQTPPSESYDLLMQYQTDPVEKAKLKKYFARTGDYQEAVNEFAKNRVRETEEVGCGTDMEIPPILEMRPATPEDLEQIADMESGIGPGGEASPCGSLIFKHGEEEDVSEVAKDEKLEKVNPTSLEKKHQTCTGDHRGAVGTEGRMKRLLKREELR